MAWYIERHSSPDEAAENAKTPENIDHDPVPHIRHVDIKGQGLITLQRSLSALRVDGVNNNPMKGPDEAPPILSDVQRQRMLEQTTAEAALDRWRNDNSHLKSLGINSALHEGSPLGALMWAWHEKLESALKVELKLADEAESKSPRTKNEEERLQWGPYLQSIPAEKISATAILACMTQMAGEGHAAGVKVVSILHKIGTAVQEECYAQIAKRDRHIEPWRRLSKVNARPGKRVRPRSWSSPVAEIDGSNDAHIDETTHWPPAITFKIAAMLLSKLIEVARVDVSRQDIKTGRQVHEPRPVFFHTFQYKAGKRIGVIRLNSVMIQMLTKAPVGSVLAKHLPMVCEPKPWVGFREGGFLEHQVKVVRFQDTDNHSRRYAATAADNGDLVQVFAGLDVLGKTPWKINRPVYEVMAQAWNSGEAVANIPAENPIMEHPPEPSPQAEAKERRQWLHRIQELENEKSGLKSERCFQNFQMEIARAFMHESFYFPHNIDFRGRAYPMAPFLNHMGADHARGLLIFAKGKELGSAGLWWLKVHLANMFGYDKASFKERIIFTENHLTEIHDSALNSMNGGRWWLQAEDPWQCLAACIELHNALQLPDPSHFISHLAIHQDGTCNGLQHYAALGGDVVGAKQVNLEPGDRPSDIYTGVAEMIKNEVRREAEDGLTVAKALDGHITRKVVKQTVMTNVYGVTFVGARRQVRKQLEDLLPDFPDTPRLHLGIASLYIAKKIFKTLATMFNGAHDIQYWLGDCARGICDSISPGQIAVLEKERKGMKPPDIFKRRVYKTSKKTDFSDFITPVTWTTPLKLPVVQPYRKEGRLRVQTEMQDVSLVSTANNKPVDRVKQLQGFPPNFIHSLDGTHMFLTALRCHELGLTFASVHDSFWTHASDVDTMNTITRDAFVRMHSENIIARLAAEFEARYKGHMRLVTLDIQSSAGRKIRKWRHAHPLAKGSKNSRSPTGKTEELLLEVQRLKLLASNDVKEREEGEAMVTPASIFAEASHEEQLAVPINQVPTTLGQTSTRPVKLVANGTLAIGEVNTTETIQITPDDKASATVADSDVVRRESNSDGEDTSEVLEGEGDQVHEGGQVVSRRSTKTLETKRRTWVWIPLQFPPVPEKGDFDVRRLKDSPYFFS